MAATATTQKIKDAGDTVSDAAESVSRQGWQGLQPLLDFALIRTSGFSITVGGLIAAVLAILVALALSMLLRRALTRYADHQGKIDRAGVYTVSRLLHYVLLAIGVMFALEFAGLPITRFAIFAGALGVGLGFGLQALFANFISGLVLLFGKSLKVGDFVELESDVGGEVRDIKMLSTRIVTNDNIDILVPNSEFVSGRVVNWTYREVWRRLRVPFGVAYGSDKELVKKAALEAAAQVPFTLDLEGARKPQVWLVNFGSSSLDFELVVWLTAEATKRPATVKAAYLWALETALNKYRIEIPFPQQDLHIRSLFGRRGDDALAAWLGREDPTSHEPVPDVTLNRSERAALSSNDAEQDVKQQMADDAACADADTETRDQSPTRS
ncbi:MAG: mechanosensitive ion channel [Lysobacter sp.]|nr:mechanosensitive ion channel [Lysobacter sp.]MDQ3269191.1 mechanosensitive ion channel [Pseudomonadota bacterium]